MQVAENEILAVFLWKEKDKKQPASTDLFTSIKHRLHMKSVSSSVVYEMVEISSLEYRLHSSFSGFASDLPRPNEISQKWVFLTVLHCDLQGKKR